MLATGNTVALPGEMTIGTVYQTSSHLQMIAGIERGLLMTISLYVER